MFHLKRKMPKITHIQASYVLVDWLFDFCQLQRILPNDMPNIGTPRFKRLIVIKLDYIL